MAKKKELVPSGVPEISLPRSGKPVMLREGSARALSMAFLADLQRHYEEKGIAIFDFIYENFPLEYFKALVALSKVVRVEAEVTHTEARKPESIDEILQRVEDRVGPRGREFFAKYLSVIGPMKPNEQD